MKIRWRVDSDEWTTEGRKITSEENIEVIQHVLDQGSVIVEHRFYRGASAPNRFIIDDFDEFINYLNNKAWAGDNICIWSFDALCRDDNMITYGKCPDDEGCTPNKGAY